MKSRSSIRPKEIIYNQLKDVISSRRACRCDKARKRLLPSQATEEDKRIQEAAVSSGVAKEIGAAGVSLLSVLGSSFTLTQD